MFEGGFRETQEQIVDLEEIEDGSRLEASYGWWCLLSFSKTTLKHGRENWWLIAE
jgi:hypothetical protein